ncbi:MAG: winged helix-turn-helix domain-containing protein [Woeseiaceae bacterium]|nr:winged helix-turn-helix domain-containing protein [Woeseiaceae bacterium]
MARILVADVDAKSRLLVANELRTLGHDVEERSEVFNALQLNLAEPPDLIVCDIRELEATGARRLSALGCGTDVGASRVLALATRAAVAAIPGAVANGIDDFIIKPVDRQELGIRVATCLQRRSVLPSSDDSLSVGGIHLDDRNRRITVDDTRVSLAPREYRLMKFLLQNRDQVFSRIELLSSVWGRTSNVGLRTVDVHIRRLRSILEPFGYDRYLQTVRGSGYRFSLED